MTSDVVVVVVVDAADDRVMMTMVGGLMLDSVSGMEGLRRVT